jgi:uncharacterized protein YecE (DUF72 family)
MQSTLKFKTVEVNNTFYRHPGDPQVQSWIKRDRDLEDYEYSVKLPQLVTHKSSPRRKSGASHLLKTASFEKTCVKPLDDAGLLFVKNRNIIKFISNSIPCSF